MEHQIPDGGKDRHHAEQQRWLVHGITPDLVTGVWTGADDRSVRFSTTDKGQGANMALPIYGYYMNKVYADPTIEISTGDFERPTGTLAWRSIAAARSRSRPTTHRIGISVLAIGRSIPVVVSRTVAYRYKRQ